MVPRDGQPEYIDVAAAIDGTPDAVPLRVLTDSDPMLANLHPTPRVGQAVPDGHAMSGTT
jgi:hypothetical protein